MTELRPPGCCYAAREFSKTTTLHGFKYLSSKSYCDRWGWLVCCCASACCAGVLCAVLWARFLQVPALLTLRETKSPMDYMTMPLVGICPPTETVAQLFRQQMVINETDGSRLPEILDHVLRRKYTTMDQLSTLEEVLRKNNVSLAGALERVMPPCNKIVRNCRWQSVTIPCESLFEQQLTQWGVCCLSNISAVNLKPPLYTRLAFSRTLSIGLQCSQPDMPVLTGCELFTKYEGEGWVDLLSTALTPGHNYVAQLSFTSVVDSDPDKLVDETCIASETYSRTVCLLRCRENFCGCLDPLRIKHENEKLNLPVCSMTKLNCLRSFNNSKSTCRCLPSCKKVISTMSLESSKMISTSKTYDNLYLRLDESSSTILNIIVRIKGSKIFVVNPTETWITLLSSLGGVFNMFLGVGLFSALEVLFLIFVRCPIAIRKSSEVTLHRDRDAVS
ncbi:sodium channel protein Nach-like [Aricia agestis]|uniref:sodium channel protein Nach-like n=1 Tax=Aricia agestis TaxID=91739 RepID=UPI001C20BC80|nr:sodium channel protein Nach-like [Aricia agestis]